jgi:DnaK suppressor protein
MTKSEKDQVLEKLISEKDKLGKKITELKDLTKPIAPDDSIGRVSRMDAINNRSVNEAALRSAERKLNEINLALEKIDDPAFGKCRNCGAKIRLGRLMIMPGSAHCVRCAAMFR